MKYSRQRESILNALNEKLDHPTAEMVYNCVKQEQPNISLGTVYRNLNQLVEQGTLRRIATPVSGDRFDIRVDPHAHLLCTCCGRVLDLEDTLIFRAGPKCHAHHRVPGQRPAAAAQRHLCGLPGCPAGASGGRGCRTARCLKFLRKTGGIFQISS